MVPSLPAFSFPSRHALQCRIYCFCDSPHGWRTHRHSADCSTSPLGRNPTARELQELSLGPQISRSRKSRFWTAARVYFVLFWEVLECLGHNAQVFPEKPSHVAQHFSSGNVLGRYKYHDSDKIRREGSAKLWEQGHFRNSHSLYAGPRKRKNPPPKSGQIIITQCSDLNCWYHHVKSEATAFLGGVWWSGNGWQGIPFSGHGPRKAFRTHLRARLRTAPRVPSGQKCSHCPESSGFHRNTLGVWESHAFPQKLNTFKWRWNLQLLLDSGHWISLRQLLASKIKVNVPLLFNNSDMDINPMNRYEYSNLIFVTTILLWKIADLPHRPVSPTWTGLAKKNKVSDVKCPKQPSTIHIHPSAWTSQLESQPLSHSADWPAANGAGEPGFSWVLAKYYKPLEYR